MFPLSRAGLQRQLTYTPRQRSKDQSISILLPGISYVQLSVHVTAPGQHHKISGYRFLQSSQHLGAFIFKTRYPLLATLHIYCGYSATNSNPYAVASFQSADSTFTQSVIQMRRVNRREAPFSPSRAPSWPCESLRHPANYRHMVWTGEW